MNIFTKLKRYIFGYEDPDKNLHIPRNLEECFTELDIILSQADLKDAEEFINCDDPGKYHFSFGMQIRNNWKLWQENTVLHDWFKAQDIWHADDMSGIILTSYHRKIKGQEIDLAGQIYKSKEFWKHNQP